MAYRKKTNKDTGNKNEKHRVGLVAEMENGGVILKENTRHWLIVNSTVGTAIRFLRNSVRVGAGINFTL